MELVIDSGIIC